MRIAQLILVMVVACMPVAVVADSGGGKVVYLDGAAALARLRATNPDHFARAQRIIAAANELCRPGPERLQLAWSGARDLACARTLLKTSNPPKREITFRLDDTRYIALVTVTDDPPRLVAAQ